MFWKSLFRLSPGFILPLLGGLPGRSLAQQTTGAVADQVLETTQSLSNTGGRMFNLVGFDKRDDGVRGTPMLFSGWLPGEIQLVGQAQPLRLPVKYDLYRQELRARRTRGDSVLVPLARVQEFGWPAAAGVPARRFVRCQAPELPAELVGTCAEVLAPGRHWQLLKLHRKVIVQQADPSAGDNPLQPVLGKAFAERPLYFLRWESTGRFEPVRLKRAAFEAALHSQPAARAALRDRRLPVGEEGEAAAAVLLLDELVQ